MAYFVGQGKVYAAKRNTDGSPKAFRYLLNCSKLNFNMKTSRIDHQESNTGQRGTDATVVTGKEISGTLTVDNWTADNLAFVLYGKTATVTGSTVSAETLPSGLVVGDFVRLDNPMLTNVVITDSTGTPKTLTADTNYKLNADHGSIEILDLTTGGAFTQPLKAAYTYASRVDVAAFNDIPEDLWLRFEGLNMADEGNPVLIEAFKCQIDPAKILEAIGEKFSEFELDMKVLKDDLRDEDDDLGQYFRVTPLT